MRQLASHSESGALEAQLHRKREELQQAKQMGHSLDAHNIRFQIQQLEGDVEGRGEITHEQSEPGWV